MAGTISEICSKLISAVEISMSQDVSHSQRLEAYTFVEQFKNDSSLQMFLDSSLFLTGTSNSAIQRHFGFQLLEHGIKHRWITMSPPEKLFVKEKCMMMLDEGTKPMLEEESFVKDAASRILVEIIKREWPQFWPEMINEVTQLSSHGNTQTELVLYMFLRLCEDIAVFQNVSSAVRRRDLHAALTSNMDSLFALFRQILITNMSCSNMEQIKLMQGVLEVIACLGEWVHFSYLGEKNGDIFIRLSQLLGTSHVCCQAALCLLQVMNRKGKVEERKHTLMMFEPEIMNNLLPAAASAISAPYSEPNYLFLKYMSELMSAMGVRLFALLDKQTDFSVPANLNSYLECVMTFSRHPSLVVSSHTNHLWAALFNNAHVKEVLSLIQNVLPVWIECAGLKVARYGFPSKDNHPTCFYSRLDFDSDEAFSFFFLRVRSEILANLRSVIMIDSGIVFNFIDQKLRALLRERLENGVDQGEKWSYSSPPLIEWDSLSHTMDSSFGKLEKTDFSKILAPGVALVKTLLEYDGSDPLLLSAWLSCVSASFVFIKHSPDLVPAVLDKVFAVMVFSYPGQTKMQRNRSVKNLRRHACSLLVKLASKYSDLLFVHFDTLYLTFQRLSADSTELSQMEKVTFLEALLLLSNRFENYERQSAFVAEIIQPGMRDWSSMQKAFETTDNFLSFVGLDKPPVEPSTDDVNGQNRAQITYCIHLLLGVVKRCAWPDSYDKALAGNFVVSQLDGGTPLYQSPAAPHVIPHLTQLFYLLRSFNGLWEPSCVAKLSEGYSRAHCLVEVEKNNILGLPAASVDPFLDIPKSQTPLERMQHFLTNVHDTCYHLLSACCSNLYFNFYPLQSLAPAINSSVFYGIEYIPDYRFRPMLRVFLRAFISSCPKAAHQTVLLPVLSSVFSLVYARINKKWEHMSEVYNSRGFEDECVANQEMLEDQLNRFLTREFLGLCRMVLIGGSSPDYNPEAMDFEGEVGEVTPHSNGLSELGSTILQVPELAGTVTLTVFRALAWLDATASLKASSLAGELVNHLSSNNLLPFDDVNTLFHCVLMGLNRNGQHDANYSSLVLLGIKMMDSFYPLYPKLGEVLRQIAGGKEFEVRKFLEMVRNPSPKNDKAKKGFFRKIVDDVTGKNIGECFKHNLIFLNLPTLVKTKAPDVTIFNRNEDIGLCNLFDS